MKKSEYKAVVMGMSAGGLDAMKEILPGLPPDFPVPVIAVQHIHASQDGFMYKHLAAGCKITVKEALDKEPIEPGHVYFAPPGYHLLVEKELSFALSIDGKVNYSRPSIDVLFESAALAWQSGLVGVILTGANYDGAKGMLAIKEHGGLTIAQKPSTAESPVMPQAAIDIGGIDKVLTIEEIADFLQEFNKRTLK